MDVAVLWGIIVLSLLIIAGAGLFVRCIERLIETQTEQSNWEARFENLERELAELNRRVEVQELCALIEKKRRENDEEARRAGETAVSNLEHAEAMRELGAKACRGGGIGKLSPEQAANERGE